MRVVPTLPENSHLLINTCVRFGSSIKGNFWRHNSVRGFYFLLATLFLTLLFCEAPGLANVVVQQKQGDPTKSMAEQLAETLSRRLPEQLSRFAPDQSARKSKEEKEESDQSSLQASLSDPIPQSSGQKSSSERKSQETSQEQSDRPQLRLPQDKPLGAAGPNRNRRPGPED